jgi:hypothetical protein
MVVEGKLWDRETEGSKLVLETCELVMRTVKTSMLDLSAILCSNSRGSVFRSDGIGQRTEAEELNKRDGGRAEQG